MGMGHATQAALVPIPRPAPRLRHPDDQEGGPSAVLADRAVDQQLREISILQFFVVHRRSKLGVDIDSPDHTHSTGTARDSSQPPRRPVLELIG